MSEVVDSRRFFCNDHKITVPIQICVSNSNGTAGRRYASCSLLTPEGSECPYFRWCTPRSSPAASQVGSPTLSQTATLPPSTMDTSTLTIINQTIERLENQAIPGPSDLGKCRYVPRCIKQKNTVCHRYMCRAHCVLSGGCTGAPNHAMKDQAATALTAPSVSSATGSLEGPTTPTIAVPPSAASVNPPAVSVTNETYAFANPRIVSQMKATFTEQYAVEQRLEEKKRAEDAEHLSSIKKAKNHAIGYGWPADHVKATICEFQGGFVWPHFVVTADVLSDLDIPLDANPSSTRVKLYNHQVHTWTKISVGHVLTLKEGDRIFLKALGVSHCLNFDDLLQKSLWSEGSVHIQNNLAGERAFVRQQLKPHTTSPPSESMFSHNKPAILTVQPIAKSQAHSTPLSDLDSPNDEPTMCSIQPIIKSSHHRRRSQSTMVLSDDGLSDDNYPVRLRPIKAEKSKGKAVKVEVASDGEHVMLGEVPRVPNHIVEAEQVERRLVKEEMPSSDDEFSSNAARARSRKVKPNTSLSMKHRARRQSISSTSGSSSPSSRSSSPSGSSSRRPIYVDSDDDEPTWPHDFYCVDVVDGFKACKRA